MNNDELNLQPLPKTGLDETDNTSQNVISQQVISPLELEQKGSPPMNNKSRQIFLVLGLAAVISGILTGYGLFKLQAKSGRTTLAPEDRPMSQVAGDNIQVGDIFGSADADTFKDSAQGYLDEGGLNGEGSHKLLRPGGDSQTVFLTSSITDLDKFAGMEVKIWGETFKAQSAGWLMDVGRVEVIATQAEPPSED